MHSPYLKIYNLWHKVICFKKFSLINNRNVIESRLNWGWGILMLGYRDPPRRDTGIPPNKVKSAQRICFHKTRHSLVIWCKDLVLLKSGIIIRNTEVNRKGYLQQNIIVQVFYYPYSDQLPQRLRESVSQHICNPLVAHQRAMTHWLVNPGFW